ncbi:MAG: M23 family metallopeptidase [Treponema sp.]|nr:M23 family metallopeptidase [Treponema sp.]
MKKFEFFNEICYSRRTLMRLYIKYGLVCVLSAVCAGSLVAGITLGAMHHNNSHGKGGLDSPRTAEGFSSFSTDAESHAVSDDFQGAEQDSELSYISYRIKKGDMIGFIASDFGVTQDTIISVNNIKASRLIQPGQYLKIPSMPGILYTVRTGKEDVTAIAEKYKVDALKCASVNNVSLDEPLSEGRTIFVPDAELDWVTRQEINGDLFKKPLQSRYYYSSWYGWRKNPFDASKRTFHAGIDMACPAGTKIYAALAGTVVKSGWSDVYGNYVVVRHHSGYESLYGHMSERTAWVGQNVTTSTVLGKVGSTGLSTGPHLHFTVYKNGRTVNPANLWK